MLGALAAMPGHDAGRDGNFKNKVLHKSTCDLHQGTSRNAEDQSKRI